MPLEKDKVILQKYVYLYEHINEIHQQNKRKVAQKRAKKRMNVEISEEDSENIPELLMYSSLYRAAERRNNLTLSEMEASERFTGVFDTQSQPQSTKSPLPSDHLSVITSTNESSTFRFEELCLILLRGVMERLVLQLNPCQESSRETLPAVYTTQAKSYSGNQWKEVMQLCRSHSSECTTMIVRLYPQVPVLRTELSRLILEFPEKYIHCPDCAMDYILDVTDTTKRWLLYWTQPALTTVIILLDNNH